VAGWHSRNGILHVNKVKLRRAWLVLGLVTIFGGCNILVFIQTTQAHSAWPSLSWVGAMNTRDGVSHLWEETAPLNLRPCGAL